MRLFNASSLFSEENLKEIIPIVNDPEQLRGRLIWVKKALLKVYNLKTLNIPKDFADTSYIIAANHLTDSDAPLILSFYYDYMKDRVSHYPVVFVFAKENCFNGVSIPKELTPVLDIEKIIEVNRYSIGGSMKAVAAAKEWYGDGSTPRHFLIFAQGTIYDVNKDKAEDIEPGAFWLSKLLGIPVLPAFIEQAVEGEGNRLVFAEPFPVPPDCRRFDEYKKLWLERVIEAQDSLGALTGTPAREVALDEEHQTRKVFKTAEAP
jgi:hypothetical protein